MRLHSIVPILSLFAGLSFGQNLNIHTKSSSTLSVFSLRTIDSITFQFPANPVAGGLVAFYPFTGNSRDGSGNGLNGTVHGPALTYDRFGIANAAYNFDGANDYIEVPSNAQLNLTENISISLWIKPSSWPTSGGVRTFLAFGDLNNQDQYAFGNWGGKTGCTYLHNGSVQEKVDTCTDWTINTWYHIAVIYDKNAGQVRFYRNGELSSTIASDFASKPILPVSNAQLRLGTHSGDNLFYSGVLDDIRIYNTVLTSAQISSLYSDEPFFPAASLPDLALDSLPSFWRNDSVVKSNSGALYLRRSGFIGESVYRSYGVSPMVGVSVFESKSEAIAAMEYKIRNIAEMFHKGDSVSASRWWYSNGMTKALSLSKYNTLIEVQSNQGGKPFSFNNDSLWIPINEISRRMDSYVTMKK